MNADKETKKVYGFLWTRNKKISPRTKWHFNVMQEVISEPIVRGLRGIDIGSGCGYDTYLMAKSNPLVKIVSMDLSDGVTKTKELTYGLKNVQIINCSVLNMPLRDNIFDFAYSFGVLHHTNSPERGLLEIARILKKNSPAFLYLYEDHYENLLKYVGIKLVTNLRKVTVKIPARIIYASCCIFSPFVFIFFSIPARILGKFKSTRHIAKNMPFNFGTGPFSLRGDLYDRFSAPIEYRFSKSQVHELFIKCGFKKICVTKLKNNPGWVVWGYKL